MQTKLKILHVTPSYYPAIKFGGPIQSVHLLNKTLVTQGVSVNVFTTNAGLEDKEEYKSENWKEIDGVKVKYFPYYGYIHYNFSPQLLAALLQVVRTYDLVHITAVWNFPVWAAATACIRAGIPYIISPRGTIYPETIALKSTLFKKLYYQLFAKRCLQHASAIHYTASDEQQKVENFLGLSSPPFVIPNGIELSSFSNIADIDPFHAFCPQISGRNYILFLSRINVKKGLDLLVDAFARISVRFPELLLVIAGPDNEGYGAVIKERLEEKNLLHKTVFPGLLSGEAKLAAYRDAQLFVLPSYSENFGMSVIEAMACGTPVLISNQVGIYHDILKHQAGRVCSLNSDEISQSVIKLLCTTQDRVLISKNAKKIVEQYYNIDTVAIMFKEKFIEIVSKHK